MLERLETQQYAIVKNFYFANRIKKVLKGSNQHIFKLFLQQVNITSCFAQRHFHLRHHKREMMDNDLGAIFTNIPFLRPF